MSAYMISRRRSKREAAVVGPEEKRYSDPGMDPRKTDPLPDRPCPLCGATERQTRHRAPTPERPDLDVVRCAGCGLLFAHPLPDRSSILARYDDGYFHCGTPLAGGYEDYARDEPLIRRTFARRWADFQALGGEPPVRRVLDVGCATGVFLDFMREKGWEAEGLEIAPGPRRAAENRGFRVDGRELTAAGLEAGRFGWITAWDVIEHLPDPGAALRECHRLLAPGGLLTLSTPDASAPWPGASGVAGWVTAAWESISISSGGTPWPSGSAGPDSRSSPFRPSENTWPWTGWPRASLFIPGFSVP